MTNPRQMSNDALLDAALMTRPTFRMGFDAHVVTRNEVWGRAVSRECFERYHTDNSFARAQDHRIEALRSTPLPAWKELA